MSTRRPKDYAIGRFYCTNFSLIFSVMVISFLVLFMTKFIVFSERCCEYPSSASQSQQMSNKFGYASSSNGAPIVLVFCSRGRLNNSANIKSFRKRRVFLWVARQNKEPFRAKMSQNRGSSLYFSFSNGFEPLIALSGANCL